MQYNQRVVLDKERDLEISFYQKCKLKDNKERDATPPVKKKYDSNEEKNKYHLSEEEVKHSEPSVSNPSK